MANRDRKEMATRSLSFCSIIIIKNIVNNVNQK